MDALIDAMVAVQEKGAEGIVKESKADIKLTIRQVIAEGDMVAVHTQRARSKPSEG
jgi:predicted SnoaL-like aldol condensation-catalyzing enzyme